MASRIIHYTAAKLIADTYSIKNRERFYLGELLPDAYAEGMSTTDSHLKISILDGMKKTYDLEKFRQLFAKELKTDDLYRGYYLHLIQDLHFRDFLYEKHQWNPRILGNQEKLYRDYALGNAYLIQKYQLKNDLLIPEGFREEALCQLYPYGVEQLARDFSGDFDPVEAVETFFFTSEMVENFLQIAVEQSLLELEALDRDSFHTDMVDMAWRNK